MSPRRRVASDASNTMSECINFTEKDARNITTSVVRRGGVSTLRRLSSDGVETISNSMDLADKGSRPTTSSAAVRGLSPRRRLASDGINVISKGMDLVEDVTKPASTLAAARGVSPRRRLASDGVDSLSKSIYFTEKVNRPSHSSIASRGMSPRRRLASDVANAVSKSTDFADKDYRPSTSSAASRGTSPRSRVASNAISKSTNSSENDSKPSTSSSALGETVQRDRLESNGDNAPKDVDTTDKDRAQPSLSAGSGYNCMNITEKSAVSLQDGVDGYDPGRTNSTVMIQEDGGDDPGREDSTGIGSENVDATKKSDRAISVKVPSRGISPRRRLASDGIDTISKSMDLCEKDKKPMTKSVPSRGMSPRRTAGSESANVMSKSMDFSDKCNGPIASLVPPRLIPTRRILGLDGANALSRSMDLTDKIRQQISSTVQPSRASPRKMPLAYNRARGSELLPGDVESPGSTDGNESQEENAGSSPDVPSNNSGKFTPPKRLARTSSSPSPVLIRPSSPSNASTVSSFASRRLPSPSRTRPSTPISPCSSARSDSASSILSYISDATRGKKSPSHLEDARQLLLLYNRNLQWRFTNAYVDEMLSIQKTSAETMLYSVWDANSRLCDSMVMERSYVQRLRQEVKLGIVLKEQMDCLDHWATLQTEHSSSLHSATEALKASTLRLPVTGGAKADVLTAKNAVSSAVDIMQAMGSSICHLLSKLQCTHSLVTELSAVAAKETTLLNEYRELLATAAALQVQESSLRTQLIQQTD
ncbi:hypothetical protein PR202_ga03032 [Eleusine coracana subsp. coracana]|uniref:AUGMIN subunit 8 n=1 Tax=Eleusine coracana subsp. coracana TaxID=191504 RepID=A0AAV5BNE1_ELECO|nr:hypothetical protein PR202_ga03032 [Eleusine coracana subsp. coracana]